jgi:hypothetical protein
MIRRVPARRGPKGHRYDGPQKTRCAHACGTRKARSTKFSRRNGSGRGDRQSTGFAMMVLLEI